MEYAYKRTHKDEVAARHGSGVDGERAETGRVRDSLPIRIVPKPGLWRIAADAMPSAEVFWACLTPKAMSDFESLATLVQCGEKTPLVIEGEQPIRVWLLVEGKMKLSMNTADGRRLNLGTVEVGNIVGLSCVISGGLSAITAESEVKCKLLSLGRQSFLNFLARHPAASQNASRQLSMEYKRFVDSFASLR